MELGRKGWGLENWEWKHVMGTLITDGIAFFQVLATSG